MENSSTSRIDKLPFSMSKIQSQIIDQSIGSLLKSVDGARRKGKRLNQKAEGRITPTTAQSLGALVKSARDTMRKSKSLNGDLDRLPMLAWIIFLKFLDDVEFQPEGESKLGGKKFKPAIESPYRWPDWAAKSDGTTAPELEVFLPATFHRVLKGEL